MALILLSAIASVIIPSFLNRTSPWVFLHRIVGFTLPHANSHSPLSSVPPSLLDRHGQITTTAASQDSNRHFTYQLRPHHASAHSKSRPRSSQAALGLAKGLRAVGLNVFLSTLRKHSTCDIHLWVDSVPLGWSAKAAEAEGIYFHVFSEISDLPSPWSSFHPASYRFYLFHKFMQVGAGLLE